MSTATDAASGASETGESNPEGADDGIVREISHDEYDPIGTLVLVAMYFVIVGLLWVFMYFVEFLGNGPTPI
jgi:hypothetical protein